MKVDLHVHTRYSPDSLTEPQDVVRWAVRAGLDAVAVTDHDTIEGAQALAASSSFPIVVGEEIRTSEGEVSGLFLRQHVAPGQTAKETMRQIHAQGGIVCMPHPLDRLRDLALGRDRLLGLVEHVDIVEVLNARVLFGRDNDDADALAREYGLLRGAGSDAHLGSEIGRAFVEVPSFHDAPSLLRAMIQASVHGSCSGLLVHLGSTYAKVVKAAERFQ
jgi:hypothetical protein